MKTSLGGLSFLWCWGILWFFSPVWFGPKLVPFDLGLHRSIGINSRVRLKSACGRRLVPDLTCNPGLFMSENDTKGALLHHGIEIDCFKIKFKLFSISDCNLTMMKLPCFIFSFYMSAVVSCIWSKRLMKAIDTSKYVSYLTRIDSMRRLNIEWNPEGLRGVMVK